MNTLEDYLNTRQENKAGCTNHTNDENRYFPQEFFDYLDSRVTTLSETAMVSFQYVPELDMEVRYISLYLDVSLNTYTRVMSDIMCDTLLNEDQTVYVAVKICPLNLFSVNQKQISRTESYIPNHMMLLHEKIISNNTVFRVYLINAFKDEKGEVKIDFDDFYQSIMIK